MDVDVMSSEPSQVPSRASALSQVLALMKRPVEYGLIGAAAVFVIWLADTLDVLPLKFKGLGTEVEFGTKERKVLRTNADQVAELEGRVQKLQSELKQVVASLQDGRELDVTTAAVASLPEDAGNVSKAALLVEEKIVSGSGSIWIGTFDPVSNSWTDQSVTTPGGRLPNPRRINGMEVSFLIDVNVRATLPEPNESYYSDVAKKGVARKGFSAKVIGDPVRYDRPTGVQYWAKVALSYVEAPPQQN